MSEKELTVFVVDLSPSMAAEVNGGTALDLGLCYVYDIFIEKLIKGRKTDCIGLVTFHSPITENPFSDGKKYKNIELIANKLVPSYQLLGELKSKLVVNSEPIAQDESDLFLAMLVGLSLFNDTKHLKYVRNLVVVSDFVTSLNSFKEEVIEPVASSFKQLNVNLVVNGIGESDLWNRLINEIGPNAYFIKAVDSIDLINNAPPFKLVRPIPLFKGNLNLGGEIKFDIHLYPMVKPDSYPTASQFYINDNSIDKIKRETDYYTLKKNKPSDDDPIDNQPSLDDDEDVSLEKKYLDKSEMVNGFKYSNFDMVATSKQLIDQATLTDDPAIDILGFLKKNDIPLAYYTDESFYVLPSKTGDPQGIVGLSSFIKSLLDLDTVAIARYVKSNRKDFALVALLPFKIKHNNEFIFTFSLIRLPFKEDEKLGRFPWLINNNNDNDKVDNDNDDNDDNDDDDDNDDQRFDQKFNYPSKQTNKLMEDFINSKSLDDDEFSDPSIIDNFKVTLTNSTIPKLPNPFFKIKSDNTNSRLLSPSPALHKFHSYYKKTIKESLNSDDLNDFLLDPEFIKKNLVDKDADPESNNFFQLSNILNLNSSTSLDWLSSKNSSSEVEKLINKLKIKYIDKEPKQKIRKTDDDKSDLDFDEVPDFDL